MRLDFNSGWIFWKDGENTAKRPYGKNFADAKENVKLPHDAMLKETRDKEAAAGSASGFFPGGVYFYEKEFEVPVSWLAMHLTLEFEGVYKNAEVFVNGEKIYQGAYGYIPFFVCLNDHIREGKNTLLVKADNCRQPDSRWYSGAGIYRPVYLHVQNKNHILLEGVQIKTVSIQPPAAEIMAEHVGGSVKIEILDEERRVVAEAAIQEGNSCLVEVPGAKLWDEHTPNLYTARVTLTVDGEIVDETEECFGFRMVSWSNQGLFVNGRKTLLRGGCVHHDNGILGACAFPESEERRIRVLKENGFNAIRSAHNPCSKAMLSACDRYGVYVMDELWDMWYNHKNKYDYAAEFESNYKEDIRALVRRDFNHPSILMYSIGNEVSEPAQGKGVVLAKEMAELIHSLDSTRAVTGGMNLTIIARSAKGKGVYKEDGGRDDSSEKTVAGMNSTMFNMVTSMIGSGMNRAANGKQADAAASPVLDVLDIAGYNYASGRYRMEGKLHPERILMGSETFPQDIAKNWSMVKELPYLVGDFMWTAWDYLGEAGIGAWSVHSDAKGFNKPYPWLLADTGAFDILGNPNGEAFLAAATWEVRKAPYIGVQPLHPGKKWIKASWRGSNAIPSWSWEGCEGEKAVVEVCTTAPTAEVFLNGRSLGRKKTKNNMASFKVKYASGTLKAVAYEADGSVRGESTLVSATGEKRLSLIPEKKTAAPGELIYVNINIAGENGEICSNADEKLTAAAEGGELLGFGSANPRTEERFDAGSYTTYYGRALAVLRVGEAGAVTLRVKGSSLTEQILAIGING